MCGQTFPSVSRFQLDLSAPIGGCPTFRSQWSTSFARVVARDLIGRSCPPTIGMLYHSRGVVFGEAMIEAFEIESRIAVYSRVVLSQRITSRPTWAAHNEIIVGNDGLHHLDYFTTLLLSAAQPGNDYTQRTKAFFNDVVSVVAAKLSEFQRDGRLKELAKWTWLARELRRRLESLSPELLGAFGVSLSEIPWLR